MILGINKISYSLRSIALNPISMSIKWNSSQSFTCNSIKSILIHPIMQKSINTFTCINMIDHSTKCFLIGAILMNLSNSPLKRYTSMITLIENIAWSHILPISLLLGIFASTINNTNANKNNIDIVSNNTFLYTWQWSLPMIISFVFGVLGSIFGGFAAIKILMNSRLIKQYLSFDQLLVCASCLVASYIGGTSNFFETSKILNMQSTQVSNIISLIASIDIGIMVLYFAILSALHNSHVRYLFKDSLVPQVISSEVKNQSNNSSTSILKNQNLWYILPLVVAIGILQLSNVLIINLKLQGVSVLLSIVMTYIIAKYFNQSNSNSQEIISFILSNQSSTLINLFYFIIGLSFHIPNLQLLGFPIISLILTILSIHLVTILGCSWLWNQVLKFIQSRHGTNLSNMQIDLDSLLLSSNSCIGGAATSAAMATSFHKSHLVILSSTLGIIGYILGTPIAIAIYKALSKV